MNLALRRGPPVDVAQNLFSPAAQNVIMGGTIPWRAQLPAHPTGTESRYNVRDDPLGGTNGHRVDSARLPMERGWCVTNACTGAADPVGTH
jgi:hypothetical protein